MRASLPPGPRAPAFWQGIGQWTRPLAYTERMRARYGKRFTVRLPFTPPFVLHSEPEHVKEIFTAPPDVLHPGTGSRVLEPLVGRNSVILLDEDPHMEQRKLILPAFHGERMERLAGMVAEVADAEIERWGRDEIDLHPRLQALTLEIILRAVFGLDPGPRLDAMRESLSALLAYGDNPLTLIQGPDDPEEMERTLRRFNRAGPLKGMLSYRDRTDELIAELIAERRAGHDDTRDDVLTMLLAARHEDGTEMSGQELRDELMTLLVAGHETTASTLAWAFERLGREPEVLGRTHRGGSLRRRLRGLPAGDDPGDAPPPPGAAQLRAQVRRQADHGRRLGLRAGSPARSCPTRTSSTTTPTSTPSPTPSGPSVSSRRSPAPTPGSRSAAGAGAASG